jgi:hypothetical protein
MARYGEISGSRKNGVGIEFRIDIQAITKQVERQMRNLAEKKINKGLQIGLTNFGEAILKDIKENAPAKHLKKENGKSAEQDETLPFMIIEFERNDKRIDFA